MGRGSHHMRQAFLLDKINGRCGLHTNFHWKLSQLGKSCVSFRLRHLRRNLGRWAHPHWRSQKVTGAQPTSPHSDHENVVFGCLGLFVFCYFLLAKTYASWILQLAFGDDSPGPKEHKSAAGSAIEAVAIISEGVKVSGWAGPADETSKGVFTLMTTSAFFDVDGSFS